MPEENATTLAGRPYKWGEPTVHKSVRIPKSIDEKLELKANREEISFSEALSNILINVRDYI